MTRLSLLTLVFMVACGGAQHGSSASAPTQITLRVPDQGSLAYRVSARAAGGESEGQGAEGALYVERDDEARVRLVFDGDPSLLVTVPRGDEAMRMVFPTMDEPVGEDPVTTEWRITQGARPGDAPLVRDTLSRISTPDERLVRFDFRRRIEVRQGISLRLDGELVYDPDAERYVRVVTRQTVQREGGEGESRSRRVELRFDEGASEERTALRARISAAEADARERYDAYVTQSTRDSEIAAAIDSLRGAEALPQVLGNAALLYHLYASPEATWARIFETIPASTETPVPELARLVELIGGTEPALLQREGITTLVEPRIATHPTALAIAVFAPVPAYRAGLTRLAAEGTEEQRTAAQSGIERLDLVESTDLASKLREVDDPEQLAHIGLDLVRLRPDSKAIVEALVTLLEETEDATRARVLAQFLTAITRQALGGDVDEWKAFVASHHEQPFSAWLVEAAASEEPTLRMSALQGLATQPPTDEARRVLREGLESPIFEIRLASASSLARYGDHAAVPGLLEALEDTNPEVRLYAFTGLAFLSETTLGYSPFASELDRAVGVARFRIWAQRDGGAPSAQLGMR